MAKARKKLLPKDFEAQLESGDLDALKAIFDTCDINARGGYRKQTALAFNQCPDGLTRWLVEQGADLSAVDTYGETPLHSRAGHWQGNVEILLELGADLHHGENLHGTPLHKAAGHYNLRTTHLLIEHGARVDALNRAKQTPLAHALQSCSNANIKNMATLAELLIEEGRRQAPKQKGLLSAVFGSRRKADAHQTPAMKAFVTRIGTGFEFHRAGFNPDYLDETSAGLDKLYALFDVPPVPRRAMHDGTSPIIARAARWEDRFQELWELLIPSKGPASTTQGEVIRIAGKIRREIDGNGGGNWDADFRKMADAFLAYVGTGTPLPDAELTDAREIITEIKRRNGDTNRMCELAVNWVTLNPTPVKLPPPEYDR
ncbi:ankyrin repeat domain-containing protein [Sphingomonas alpina]|uniref:Ankyrin repeat domain-containing protein n=1 Tax=Sphingomonas alpina TaxID=653931 RepID=A0A7H0LP76_9SPHN|nr:ankyrin repeat domain-containing protein [Sphingomonas alpina]QNQ11479.1 ankyrin repeat domain-containing protein [Sphingomonas alpina]